MANQLPCTSCAGEGGISAAEIEAAAEAIWNVDRMRNDIEYARCTENTKGQLRREAEAALTAALAIRQAPADKAKVDNTVSTKSNKDIDGLWKALMSGVDDVDESIDITSSDINNQTAGRMNRWLA